MPGIGAEIVLTVDGELRKTCLFRSHEQAELVGAIADTRAMFDGKEWPDVARSPGSEVNFQGLRSRRRMVRATIAPVPNSTSEVGSGTGAAVPLS